MTRPGPEHGCTEQKGWCTVYRVYGDSSDKPVDNSNQYQVISPPESWSEFVFVSVSGAKSKQYICEKIIDRAFEAYVGNDDSVIRNAAYELNAPEINVDSAFVSRARQAYKNFRAIFPEKRWDLNPQGAAVYGQVSSNAGVFDNFYFPTWTENWANRPEGPDWVARNAAIIRVIGGHNEYGTLQDLLAKGETIISNVPRFDGPCCRDTGVAYNPERLFTWADQPASVVGWFWRAEANAATRTVTMVPTSWLRTFVDTFADRGKPVISSIKKMTAARIGRSILRNSSKPVLKSSARVLTKEGPSGESNTMLIASIVVLGLAAAGGYWYLKHKG